MTRDVKVASEWLARFEGAGLDGVIAKPAEEIYQPGKRAMIKVKHVRTAECVVAGFRWHKAGKDELVGSLLLGLYDDRGGCITSASPRRSRWRCGKQLASELAPLREHALDDHPWREWAERRRRGATRMPGGQSRWSAGKDLSWEPLRIERVCEVKYDHMQGDRFRHAAVFLRWRPDKPPAATAATISSRSRLLTSSRRSSARSPASLTAPVVRRLVGIERFLRRPQLSGTCCRLMRMRVHVRNRPRIASTSTSAGSRCAPRPA